jgi:carbonic anhydrase/acetyltransferase-like protein (isoleucine patch superfamily)
VVAVCEGLGPVAERAFLAGKAADHRSGAVAPDTVVWAERSRRALHALGRPARGLATGRVNTPGAWIATAADAPEVSLPSEDREFTAIRLPDGEPLVVADAWIFDIDHWSRLLWANLLALGPFLWAELVGGAAGLAWGALRAGSTRPERVAAVLTRRGRGVSVHPSAVVEGCWLGEGARVGAGAVVRGAVLGDGAVVEELALVEGAVVAAGARVQRQAMVKFSVIEADAAVAGTLQLGVVGTGAKVKHGAVLMDQPLGQRARVLRQGRWEDARGGMLGCCVGPGAVVGQGVRVAPGRAIPAGLTVLGDPGHVLRSVRVPEGCARAFVRDGALVPSG